MPHLRRPRLPKDSCRQCGTDNEESISEDSINVDPENRSDNEDSSIVNDNDYMMERQSNREFLKDFIEMYRSFPCLWMVKSPEYSNRLLKTEAYSKMVEMTKKRFPYQKVDINVVKKKIQAIRTVYKKELNKIMRSKRSGASNDNAYVPKLWYFEMLNFTRDQEVSRPSVALLAASDDSGPTQIPEDGCQAQLPSQEELYPESKPLLSQDCKEPLANSQDQETPPAPPRSQSSRVRKRKEQLSTAASELTALAKTMLQKDNPELEGLGMMITAKLARMEEQQREHCERVVLEALRKGLAGTLDEHSTVTAPNAADSATLRVPKTEPDH